MTHPNKKRLRRTMMFLNCQKPGLIKIVSALRQDWAVKLTAQSIKVCILILIYQQLSSGLPNTGKSGMLEFFYQSVLQGTAPLTHRSHTKNRKVIID